MALQYFDITDPLFGGSTSPSANNYQPITDAIASAQLAGGGVVFLPHGHFRITQTILMRDVQNIALMGSGPGTVLYLDNTQNPFQDVLHIGDTPPLVPPPPGLPLTRNNSVVSMTIDRDGGVANAATAGIRINDSQYTHLANLEIHNQGAAVYVDAYLQYAGVELRVTEVSVVDTNIDLKSEFNFNAFPFAGIYAGNCSNLKVQNVFIEPTQIGINIDKKANGVLVNQTTVVCGIPYPVGVRFGGDGFCRFMTGCIVENADQAQIFIEGGTTTHVSNSWLGNGTAPTPQDNRRGVLIQPGVEDVVIANCRIGDQSIAGIHTLGERVVITGNTFDDCAQVSGQGTILVQNGLNTNITNNNIVRGGNPAIVLVGPTDYTVVTGNDAAGQGFLNAAAGVNLIAPAGSNFF